MDGRCIKKVNYKYNALASCSPRRNENSTITTICNLRPEKKWLSRRVAVHIIPVTMPG